MAPATATVNAASDERLRDLIAPLVRETGGPVTALRAIQDERGWIESEALDVVADVFNLSRAEVRGLVEFYADFRSTPPAEHVVAVCQAEACQAAGSRALTRELEERLEVGLGRTSSDRQVSLEAVYCLGLCARAPALMVDGRLVVHGEHTQKVRVAGIPAGIVELMVVAGSGQGRVERFQRVEIDVGKTTTIPVAAPERSFASELPQTIVMIAAGIAMRLAYLALFGY